MRRLAPCLCIQVSEGLADVLGLALVLVLLGLRCLDRMGCVRRDCTLVASALVWNADPDAGGN
jgi:hypothetical protein